MQRPFFTPRSGTASENFHRIAPLRSETEVASIPEMTDKEGAQTLTRAEQQTTQLRFWRGNGGSIDFCELEKQIAALEEEVARRRRQLAQAQTDSTTHA